MRVGRARPPHGAPPRGECARLQHLDRAGPLRARARAGGGPLRARGVHRGRLPQHPRPLRRVHVGRDAGARGARELPGLRVRHRPLPGPGRARAAPLHRPRPSAAPQSLDPQAHLPRRLSPHPGRGHARRAGARVPVRDRRREPPDALCPDPRPLARALREVGRARGGDVRRGLRARLAPLPRGLGGVVQHELPAALPAHLRPRRGRPALDASRRRRRRRARRLGLRGSPPRGGPGRGGDGPRGVPARQGLRGVDHAGRGRDPAPRPRGLCPDARPAADHALPHRPHRPGRGGDGLRSARQLRHPPLRVRRLPPRPLRGARARGSGRGAHRARGRPVDPRRRRARPPPRGSGRTLLPGGAASRGAARARPGGGGAGDRAAAAARPAPGDGRAR